jgi:hypothetical protein
MYQAEISRANPSCFVFLIDQSSSMRKTMAGTVQSKASFLAGAINGILRELLMRSYRDNGEVADFFDVAVIGYGPGVGSALGGALADRDLVKTSELAHHRSRTETVKKVVQAADGRQVAVEETVPVWVEPLANAATPMCEALDRTFTVLEDWVQRNPRSFPPIVLNLTDGEATDGDPTGPAQRVRSLSTADGSVLLFNLHISAEPAEPTAFPSSADGLPEAGKRLFRISDVMPAAMRVAALDLGLTVEAGSRGFVFNSDITSIVHFLDVGTRRPNIGRGVR